MGYLVIQRRLGERIKIGDDIEIMITSISNNERKVDIAIDAPRELKIIRLKRHIEEIYGVQNSRVKTDQATRKEDQKN